MISESVNLPSTSTDASAADDHVTPKHIQPQAYRKAADRTDKLQHGMENQNFLTNTPVKVQIEDELAKRCKQVKSRVKMSKACGKGNIISIQRKWRVFFVALTSEHNETLEAEKHGSIKCDTCGKWAHAARVMPQS